MISTSPSLYLQVLGTAAASDQCTTIGPVLTDPIITLAPGDLSTWGTIPVSDPADPCTLGQTWGVDCGPDMMALYAYGTFAPLNVRDLACPTWGLGRSTSGDGTVVTTIGPPFLPVIVPPKQALSLDPVWESMCAGIRTDGFQLGSFLIFDPPKTLSPASRMVPPPVATQTPATNNADPTTVAKGSVDPPASVVPPTTPPKKPEALPTETGDPQTGRRSLIDSDSNGNPSTAPYVNIDPPTSIAPSDAGNFIASPTTEGDRSAVEGSISSGPNSQTSKPGSPPIDTPTHSNIDPGNPDQDPVVGATIYNALGATGGT